MKLKIKTNKELTSDGLKSQLWDTLLLVKNKNIDPKIANAVAAQSREIMRVVKTELAVIKMTGRKPSAANLMLLSFSPR